METLRRKQHQQASTQGAEHRHWRRTKICQQDRWGRCPTPSARASPFSRDTCPRSNRRITRPHHPRTPHRPGATDEALNPLPSSTAKPQLRPTRQSDRSMRALLLSRNTYPVTGDTTTTPAVPSGSPQQTTPSCRSPSTSPPISAPPWSRSGADQ